DKLSSICTGSVLYLNQLFAERDPPALPHVCIDIRRILHQQIPAIFPDKPQTKAVSEFHESHAARPQSHKSLRLPEVNFLIHVAGSTTTRDNVIYSHILPIGRR